jgi:DNA-binding NtrC family response regulator
MNSTALWENQELEPPDTAHTKGDEDSAPARSSITALKELTFQLLRQVQSIGEVKTLSFKSGLDFYDEVRRFEIDLIKRALLETRGHQGRAATLLKLKVTTLNSKIKHYNISAVSFGNGYAVADASEVESHQHS